MNNKANIKSCIIVSPKQDIRGIQRDITIAFAKTLQRFLTSTDINDLIKHMQNNRPPG